MISKRFKISLIKWCLRFILFIVVTYVVYDFGIDIIYSLITATVFTVFWIWLMIFDYEVNPVIKWDEEND